MAKGKNQHVVPTPEGWGIRGEGNKRLTKVTETKAEAINIARKISKNQNSELIIHGRNGKIQRKDSHGNDPCPPRDKK